MHLSLPSEEQSRLAARKYARVVQKLGFPARFLDFKIQNMVGSCDVRFAIRLEGLVLTHQQFSRYDHSRTFCIYQDIEVVLWAAYIMNLLEKVVFFFLKTVGERIKMLCLGPSCFLCVSNLLKQWFSKLNCIVITWTAF